MKNDGFTMVELMLVLVVLLVLSTLVYANLNGFAVKSRRTEAQVALLELMQEQERHFTRHNTYVAFAADSQFEDARRFKWFSGSDAASSGYELRGQACAGQAIKRCIELLALPGTARVDANFKDPQCQTLSLNSEGRHLASGPDPKCWP